MFLSYAKARKKCQRAANTGTISSINTEANAASSVAYTSYNRQIMSFLHCGDYRNLWHGFATQTKAIVAHKRL